MIPKEKLCHTHGHHSSDCAPSVSAFKAWKQSLILYLGPTGSFGSLLPGPEETGCVTGSTRQGSVCVRAGPMRAESQSIDGGQ